MTLKEVLTAIMAMCFHLGTGGVIFGIASPNLRIAAGGLLLWAAAWCVAQVRA